jgi:hypothetical protein
MSSTYAPAVALDDARPRFRGTALLLLALLAVVIGVYWPGVGGGFVFDDFPNIVDNNALHVTRLVRSEWLAALMSSPASALQRPLAMLTFAMNHYFTGLDPRPMKVTNIAIHTLNTVLVFGLVRILILTALRERRNAHEQRADLIALFVAACWALQPINFLAVLFIVQRMESLCHSFVFAGLWLYLSGRFQQLHSESGGWKRIWAGLVLFTALGLLVKESAVLLPLYAFCVEICLLHFRGRNGERLPHLYALFVMVLAVPALVGLAWLLPRTAGAFAGREFTVGERLLSEPRAVLTYLRWIIFPDLGQLSLYHDDFRASHSLRDPITTLPASLALFGLLLLAWLCRIRRPLVSLGLLWFLGAQLLTGTFIALELMFEHRNYFASLGIMLALADLLLLAPGRMGRRHVGECIAVVFLLISAGITHLRAIEWSNQYRFSISEAAKRPGSPRATYDAARTMVIVTGYRRDSPYTGEALAALQRALAVPHNGVLPDQAMLMYAARTGLPLQPEWWRDIDTKLSTLPLGPQEYAALATLTKCAIEKHCDFPRDDMLRMYSSALAKGPNAEVLNIYGDYALNVTGDPQFALRLWRQASAMRPSEAQYHVSLAKLYILLNRFPDARQQIVELHKLGRLGQFDVVAHDLELRMSSASAGGKPAGQPQR